MLLRAAGAGGGVGEVVLVLALAVLPSASDAIAQTFHPQDLMSMGLIGAGTAQALRRRWVAVGVVFAVAFLCKQFAVLPMLAVLGAAPGWRDRARILVPAVGVVALGIVPFYLAAPVDTVRAMTAVFVAGVTTERTPTVVGLLAIGENLKLEIARDAPIVASVLLAVWARWRAGRDLLAPIPLVGLGVACLATRLVFEISLLNYYFLAVGVGLLLLDLTRRRVPLWSVTWIVATRFVLSPLATASRSRSPVSCSWSPRSSRSGSGWPRFRLGLEPWPRRHRQTPSNGNGDYRQGLQGLARRARPLAMASRRCRSALGQ